MFLLLYNLQSSIHAVPQHFFLSVGLSKFRMNMESQSIRHIYWLKTVCETIPPLLEIFALL